MRRIPTIVLLRVVTQRQLLSRGESILSELPRILLLEQDAQIASDLVAGFEKAGADVITADHAVQAIQRLAQFTFHGAVIDYRDGAVDRTRVARRLVELQIPFAVRTPLAAPPEWGAPSIASPHHIVTAVMGLLQARGKS